MVAAPGGADFGSLHAFLGSGAGGAVPLPRVSGSKGGLASALGPGVPLPVRPAGLKREASTDGTLLNKKVAFKMLKQLGCEVRIGGTQGEPEPFIEVSKVGQPVLFQMLLEFGYDYFCGQDGAPTIRVVERRQRSQDEVAAALSKPRQVSQPETEGDGWPVIAPRPKLRPEEEQELVRRLAAPRVPKAGESAAHQQQQPQQQGTAAAAAQGSQEPPRFRTKAEQQSHLERLLRPRAPTTEASHEEEAEAAAAATAEGAGGSSSSRGPPARARSSVAGYPSATWPVPSAAGKRTAAGGGTPPAGGAAPTAACAPVRPSPRLAQAGLSSLTRASSSATMASSAAPPRPPPTTPSALVAPPPTAQSTAVAEEDEELPPVPCAARAAGEALQEAPPASPQPTASTSSAGRGKRESEDWLERILGPPSWQGRQAPRSRAERAEHLERLERLAKPRPRPEEKVAEVAGEAEKPPPQRSPRSQREYLNRLAAPRRPPQRPNKGQPEAGLAPLGDEPGEEGALDFSAYEELLGSEPPSPLEQALAGGAPLGDVELISSSSNLIASLVSGLGGKPLAATRAEAGAGAATADSLAAAEAEEPQPDVVLVPSLLAQCQGRLARIDEEQANDGTGGKHSKRRRRPARAQSVPAAGAGACPSASSLAAAYAAPVVPSMAGSRAAVALRRAVEGRVPRHLPAGRPGPSDREGQEARGRRSAWQTPPPEGEEGYEDGEEEFSASPWGGEEMLEDIDRLYAALLTGEGAAPAPRGRAAPAAGATAPSAAAGRQHGHRGHRRERAAAADATRGGGGRACGGPSRGRAGGPAAAAGGRAAGAAGGHAAKAHSGTLGDEQEGEDDVGEDSGALLEDIDKLYSKMLHGGGAEGQAEVTEEPAEPQGGREADRSRSPSEVEFSVQEEESPSRPPLGTQEEPEPPEEDSDEDEDSAEAEDEEQHRHGAEGDTTDAQSVTPEALWELLQETLWSALLTARGAGDRAAVEASMVRLFPPSFLGQCLRAAGRSSALPASLSQRIAAELPRLHEALTAGPQAAAGCDDLVDIQRLARAVRVARDYILALACSSEIDTEALDSSTRLPAAAAPASAGGDAKALGRAADGLSGSGHQVCLKAPLPPRPPRVGSASASAAPSAVLKAASLAGVVGPPRALAACRSGTSTPGTGGAGGCGGTSARSSCSSTAGSGSVLRCSSQGSASQGSLDQPGRGAKRRSRSSLSYWTPMDLEALEARG